MHGMGSGRQGSRLVNDAVSFSPSSREAPGASELHPKHRAGRSRSPLARPANAQPDPSQPPSAKPWPRRFGLDRANPPCGCSHGVLLRIALPCDTKDS
jgi:hypothetical protein